MNCQETKKLLSEYIDGELSEGTAASVTAHLAECAGCKETHESLTRIIGYMSDMERVEEPANLLGDVRAKLEKGPSFSDLLRRLFAPPAVRTSMKLAGVALVAVLIIHMSGTGGGPNLIDTDLTEKSELSDDFQEFTPPEEATVQPVKRDQASSGVGSDNLAVRGGRSEEIKINLEDQPAAPVLSVEAGEKPALSDGTGKGVTGEVKLGEGISKKGDLRQSVLQEEERDIPAASQPELTTSKITSFDRAGDEDVAAEKSTKPGGFDAEDKELIPAIRLISVSIPAKERRVQVMESNDTDQSSSREEPVMAVIRVVGGKIIASDREKENDGGMIAAITAEIPADSLDSLLTRLTRLGLVEAGDAAARAEWVRDGKTIFRIILR